MQVRKIAAAKETTQFDTVYPVIYANGFAVICRRRLHCITVTPKWARWRLKSPASRLSTQPFFQAHIKKHQSSASLSFVRGISRWPVNSLHKWPVTRQMFPFDDVFMNSGYHDVYCEGHPQQNCILTDSKLEYMFQVVCYTHAIPPHTERHIHTCWWVLKYYGTYRTSHDDVIKWKHFPRYWPFVRGIHRSPATSQW